MTYTKLISHSVLDSNRFNLNIYRGVMADIDILYINKMIEDNLIDILILRFPVETKDSQFLISELDYPFIHADTLVYYDANLKSLDVKKMKNDLVFEPISEDNFFIIERIIPEIFSNYKNHYSANPILDKNKILAGYLEWTKSYINLEQKEKVSWVVKKNDSFVGFATCSMNTSTKECEGVLYGVHPDFSGQGIYSDLIRFTQQYFKDNGFQTMKVSTQIQNFSVQRAWSRENFLIKSAFDTYHINCFLKNSHVYKKDSF